MTCKKIQSRLSAFLDGELSEHDQQVVKHHLDQCDRCSAQLAAWRRIDTLLDDGVRLQTDPYLLTRVKTSIKNKHTTSRWILSSLQKVVLPATVVAGLMIGIMLGIQLHSLSYVSAESAAEPASRYSVIDPNIFEPVPSGSITATYTSVNSIK